MSTPAFLSQLGSPPRVGYLPGLKLAPAARHASLRRNVTRNFTPPTQRLDPADVQRAGAVISGLAVGLVLLDHNARQLQGMGQMRHETKALLNRLVALTDEVLATVSTTFDNADADSVNVLSDVVTQSVELLLQLKPAQIEASLHHMHGMASTNLVYQPAPTP